MASVSFLFYYSEATELYIQAADYNPTCQLMSMALVKDLGFSEALSNSSLVSIERNTTDERVTLMSVVARGRAYGVGQEVHSGIASSCRVVDFL